MVDQGRNICQSVGIPVIGDGDTGYGNPMNVIRTVKGFVAAGFAAIMIEDQVAPKRCGHTRGKTVVERNEALTRIQAAVDTRNAGADILIVARTDARRDHGLDEALVRARGFCDIGAELPGAKLANMLEGGDTLNLGPKALQRFRVRRRDGQYRAPSLSAIRSLLVRVNPAQLDAALRTWHEAHGGGDSALAIDGKTIRGAIDADGNQTHVLGIVGHGSKAFWGQKKSA